MPTDEQIQGAMLDITNLQTAPYRVSFDGITVAAQWAELSVGAMTRFLEEKVTWEGFTMGQRVDVEFRVIAGESRDMWFEDIRLEREIVTAELILGHEELIADRSHPFDIILEDVRFMQGMHYPEQERER